MLNIFLAKDVIIIRPRELEIAKMVAKGETNRNIGNKLGISDRTVQATLTKVYKKLNINSRNELLPVLLKNNLIKIEEL